jgi:putative transposase
MPQDSQTMYRWRRASKSDRDAILKERRRRNHPSHSPAHIASDQTDYYMITAACFEHRPIIGYTLERMASFSVWFCDVLDANCDSVFAWVVLSNHYHALVDLELPTKS